MAEDLEGAQRGAGAAAAAHGHRPGDPCPVCDRKLPGGWQPPESPDLERARRSETGAKSAYDTALAESQKATERRARGAEAFLAATSNMAAKLSALARAAEDRSLPVPTTPQLPEVSADAPVEAAREVARQASESREPVDAWRTELEEVLVPLRANANNAADAAGEAERAVGAARTRAGDAARAVTELEKEEARLKEAERGSASAIEAAIRRIDDLQASIPERWGSLVDAVAPESIQATIDACSADREAVAAAVEARDNGAAVLARAEQQITSLQGDIGTKVSEPFATARGELLGLADVVRTLARVVGLPEPAPLSATATLAEALEVATGARMAAEEARAAAAARVEQLERQRQELAEPARRAIEGLLDLKGRADPDGAWIAAAPDPGDPLSATTSEAVQQLVGAAIAAAGSAKREASSAEADGKTAKELDERLQALVAWRADLAGATEVLKKENFPAWARDQRIAELVDAASKLLAGMTGGRYGFDSHLRICDEVAGAVRAAMTLSGGEKFEAALALALGVAEIAGRSGIRFDTLFLDEGFAGLDQPNLDRALDALDAEVEQGRRVVLITHIGAVADRIRDVLLVEPDGMGGSKTRWLNEEERYELGADLDLAEAGAGG